MEPVRSLNKKKIHEDLSNISCLCDNLNGIVIILNSKLTGEGHTKLELLSLRICGLVFVGGSSCQVFYSRLFLAAFVSV